MKTRKLHNFTDMTLDRQFVEIIDKLNTALDAPVTINAACTDLTTAVALVNQIRAALISKGICI